MTITAYPPYRTTQGGIGSILGYSTGTFTNGQTYTTSQTPAGMSVTVSVPAGRTLRITAFMWAAWSLTTAVIQARIQEDGVNIGTLGNFANNTGHAFSMYGIVLRSPAAGVHTYSILIEPNVTAGTMALYNGTSNIPYISVEDVTLQGQASSNNVVGLLAQAQVTTDNFITGVTLEAALPGLSVNVAVPSGRNVKLRGEVYLQNTGAVNAAAGARLFIKEGATYLQQADLRLTATNVPEKFIAETIVSPSAGAHTYNLSVDNGGGGAITARAGTGFPAILYAEDITPSMPATAGAPSTVLAYAEVTANQPGIVTEVDLTGLTVTVTVPAGRRLKISGHVDWFTDTANGGFQLLIKEGTTNLNRFIAYTTQASNGTGAHAEAIITPTAGTHTYKLAGLRAVTGTVTLEAAATLPAFILVEDITGSVWPDGVSVTAGLIASEAWTPWTPTLGADTTAPTMGTSPTQTGRYMKYGRLVTGNFILYFGAGMTAGSGSYRLNLPVPAAAAPTDHIAIGSGYLYSGSILRLYSIFIPSGVSTWAYMLVDNAAGTTFVTSSSPWAWAAGNRILGNLTYEAAA